MPTDFTGTVSLNSAFLIAGLAEGLLLLQCKMFSFVASMLLQPVQIRSRSGIFKNQ